MKFTKITGNGSMRQAFTFSVAFGLMQGLVPSARAATIQKANNGDALNLTTSWIGGVVPGANDIASWNSTLAGANFTDLGADLGWQGISIKNPGGGVVIGGANTLTVGTSGIDMSSAIQDLVITSGLTIAGGQFWNVATGRVLAVGTGAFTRTAGATLVARGGAGIITTTTITTTNGIVGPWAVVNTSGNYSYATISSGNVVGYTGGTPSADFNWTSSNNNTFNYEVAATGAVVGVDRVANTVRFTGGAGTQNFGINNTTTITLNGLLNSGSGMVTLGEAGGTSQGQLAIGTNNGNELVFNAANSGIVVAIPIINTGATAGSIVATGPNTVTIGGAGGLSTYTGNTTVSDGTLVLSDNARLRFVIGANGINNTLSGNGGVTLDGDFDIDLTGAGPTAGNTWNLVNVGTLNETYGSTFGLVGFTESAGVHTKTVGTNTYSFTETTGNLTVAVATGYALWAGTNAGNQAANLDFDHDGTKNGVEYFMNSAAGFTANPAVVNGKVVWPNGGKISSGAYGTQFVVQTSPDLIIWTDVVAGDPNLSNTTGSVQYTLLAGSAKNFVRLSVTPD